MGAQQTYSLDQIKDMLHAQIDSVVHQYAPIAPGSYTDKGLYFTLNPGRADRSVGSFCVHLSGPKVGRWNDYATGDRGDVLDLIRLCLNLSPSDAIREARAFLGLQNETPELIRARKEAADRAAIRRREQEAELTQRAVKRQKQAEAMYLAASPISDTPVARYLANRAIGLDVLPRIPGAIRYHAELSYHFEEIDTETGEVFTVSRKLPGMVASVTNGKGATIAAHRTYLGLDAQGQWAKARLPNPRTGEVLPAKKVFGDYRGGCIRLSSGIGPQGGKGVSLAQCPPGTRVYIAEGIETALSAMVLRPEARVLAAISLSNMGLVELPQNVSDVVLITDSDAHPQAQAALMAAIQSHAAKGRRVSTWASQTPGEDLNDALQRAVREQQNMEGAA